MNHPEFEIDAAEVERTYPTLGLRKVEGGVFLAGEIPVIDKEGKLWHTYSIEIHPVAQYPFVFPIVFETGGDIRRIADWHINSDGSCCLDNEFSQEIKCFSKLPLSRFIENELIPWFANQSYRRETGNYVNGEQAHGDIGRIEFFMQELNAPNFAICVKWMEIIANKKFPPRQASQCICGANRKWRKCHKSTFDKLCKISYGTLSYAIKSFSRYLGKGPSMIMELQKHTPVNLL